MRGKSKAGESTDHVRDRRCSRNGRFFDEKLNARKRGLAEGIESQISETFRKTYLFFEFLAS